MSGDAMSPSCFYAGREVIARRPGPRMPRMFSPRMAHAFC
jgi:hypothetical protein